MAPELVLYDNAGSTNALKVAWLLDELGLPARRVAVPIGGPFPEGYLALNPFGLLPTLVDGDVVISQSNTALRHLAEREGRDDLRGATPAARARVDVLLDALSLEVRPHLWGVEEFAIYAAAVPEAERPERIAALQQALTAYDALLHPDGPWALGDTLTVADFAIGGRGLHVGRLPLGPACAPRLRRVLAALSARRGGA